MKPLILVWVLFFAAQITNAQSPVGKWKILSHISEYTGQTFDSHAALLQE